jgi:hypothetical protein
MLFEYDLFGDGVAAVFELGHNKGQRYALHPRNPSAKYKFRLFP